MGWKCAACCDFMNATFSLSDEWGDIYVTNFVVSTTLILSFAYVFWRLQRKYSAVMRYLHGIQSHRMGEQALTNFRSPLMPVYHSFVGFAVLVFLLEVALLFLPNGRVNSGFTNAVFVVQCGFLDNSVLVFLLHKDAKRASRKSAAIITCILSSAYLIFVFVFKNAMECSYCNVFLPIAAVVWVYLAFSCVYIGLFIAVYTKRLIVRRPIMLWLCFLTACYGGGSIGLVAYIYTRGEADWGFCWFAVFVYGYSALFAPLAYHTFKRDSEYCYAHDLVDVDAATETPLLNSTDIGAPGDLERAGGAGNAPAKGKGKEMHVDAAASNHSNAGSSSTTANNNSSSSSSTSSVETGGEMVSDEVKRMRADSTMVIIRDDELEGMKRVAAGGYGEVYRATWRGRRVAVKRILSLEALKNGKDEASVVDTFLQEIELLSRLKHPNVVEFIGCSLTDPQVPALVTEWMPRGNLFQLLHEKKHKSFYMSKLPWALRLNILTQVAKGMAYLHAHDPPIIHRDLKPHNVLLDMDFRVKLCDFGVSRELVNDKTMTRIGTIQWCAGEMLRGERYTEKVDVYSFGVLMWETITREIPFESISAPLRIMHKVAFEGFAMELPSAKQHKCHADAPELLSECWSHDPDQRPSFNTIVARLEAMAQKKKQKKKKGKK